jgi:hypothetical protein
MHEATPPADDSETFEERFRRIKEYKLWVELCVKYAFPEEDSVAGLAGRLQAAQVAESQDEDLRPYYLEVASQLNDRIMRAHLEKDGDFLRRLSEAEKGNPSASLTLKATGYALKAFGQLRKELGHGPNIRQLSERFERLRKQDGYPKLSARHWRRVLENIEPLFPHG